jgi:hypothetical protein
LIDSYFDVMIDSCSAEDPALRYIHCSAIILTKPVIIRQASSYAIGIAVIKSGNKVYAVGKGNTLSELFSLEYQRRSKL